MLLNKSSLWGALLHFQNEFHKSLYQYDNQLKIIFITWLLGTLSAGYLMCVSWVIKCVFFVFVFVFLAFDFCQFCVVIRFFHTCHNCQCPQTSKDFLSQIVSITFIFLSSFLRKSQYFSFLMVSAKQGHYWYHFQNVFGMTRSLTGD